MSEQALDESSIRTLSIREAFERGRDYWRSGAVSTLVRRGDELCAEVEGSEIAPYCVTIRLHQGGVADARCTCPYDWGGYCKHIVATLLQFADNPSAVTAQPSLQDLLRTLDRDVLVELIIKRADSDPDLVGWIEAELATAPRRSRQSPVDVRPLAAQAHSLLVGRYRQRRYWDDYWSSGDIAELQTLVEKAVPFLEAGDGRNALRILEAVAQTFVDDWIEYSSGSDEHMYDLFDDLGRMMAEAALMSDLTVEERDDLSTTVAAWQDQLADYGLEGNFDVAICALKNGWDEPALQAVLAGTIETWPPDEAENGESQELTLVRLRVLDACANWQACLNLARAAGIKTSVAGALVKLDRVPEAVRYALENFDASDESLDFAKILREAGRHDEALIIAEAGLRFGSKRPRDDEWWLGRSVVPLARWLRDYAGPIGRRDIALTAAKSAFAHTLSLDDYRATKNWAGEHWETIRQDLLGCLMSARYASERTEILLSEGLIDDAVRCVGDGAADATSDAVLMRLMDTAYAAYPDWVIRLAERKAARIMDAGASTAYDRAAEWLKRAALAYDAAGRTDDWTATIETLIDRHRRKYRLRPLLEALRHSF